MSYYKQFLSFSVALFCFVNLSFSQTVRIVSIEINGLKKTKEKIVLNDLTFVVGDTIDQADLGIFLERNQNNLLNLGLFNEVAVNVAEWDTEKDEIEILIEVKESWYIYAVPILELADRNFNVWWTTYHHSLDRLNLGARLDYLNFTGHNDKLKAQLQFGYTPKQEVEYRFPYFNRKQSIGLTASILHSANKEINYITLDNHEQFIKIEDRRLMDKLKADVKLQFRPSTYLKHDLSWTLEQMNVDGDIISDYNPRFFRNGKNKHTSLTARYAYEFDDRDLRIFPSAGIRALFEIEKIGWGKADDENMLTSTFALEWNHQISGRFQQRVFGTGRYSLSRSQPSYAYYSALGFGQKYVRGYELYVINGLDYMIGKYQVAYKLLEKQVQWGKFIPVEEFRKMAVQVFLSIHAETGYVKDPYTGEENNLANRWLYGGGLGLNLLLYHNFLIQLNMNANHKGETGFFIHNQTSF